MRFTPIPWPRTAKAAPATDPTAASAQPEVSPDTALWQALLRTTADAVLLADASGQVLLANPAALRLFSAPGEVDAAFPFGTVAPAPLAGTLLTHTLSSELDEVFQNAVRHGTALEADVALPQPTPRSLHVRIMPISEDQFLLVLRDLTELRRLERMRRDFVANVSHELRTPLTSIKAMAETLLDGARLDESVASRFLETIMRESDRLVRLSSDLLDLSRVEALGPNKESIDLAALVAEVASRFTAPAQKAGVSLTDQASGPLWVMADRDAMAQVIVNLLDNAITYTPRDGAVTITAREAPESVTVAVVDTGIGVLSHDLPRLFERFYRADKARSRASGGTGLGLSIVKHIVENHGGTVGVESEYNRGSVFTFTLPK